MSAERPLLRKCSTLPEMSGIRQPPPLPPAVTLVDSKGYVHSKKVNNYLVGGELGEGSFAKVKEAFHVLVGEKVRPGCVFTHNSQWQLCTSVNIKLMANEEIHARCQYTV